MQLRKDIKFIFIALFISLVFILFLFFIVKAGSLTPSGPVGSTMHSLQEVYDVLAGDTIAFTGSGTDNMTTGGSFTGGTTLNYRVQIDAIGTPDTFTWSDDGGSTWDAAGVAITGAAQTLNNGVTVTFSATTGHTLGDRWDFTRQASDINGNIIQQLKYISDNIGGSSTTTLQIAYDNSTSPEISGNKGTTLLTLKQSGLGNIFDLQNATSAVFSIDKDGNISTSGTTFAFAGAGEISSGGIADLTLNAGSGKIKAAAGSTFYNKGGYAITASGEEILRASIPIFGYDFPARTVGTKTISREIKLDANSFPILPAGADRIYKFKIQYSNDAINANTSSWQIYDVTAGNDFGLPFEVENTGIANLNDSKVYYAAKDTNDDAIALPPAGNVWHLVLTAPTSTTIQVYQIELLAYDVLQ